MKSNDFDSVAFIYDRLARLVFGKSIVHSQKYFLNKIPKGSKVLILGGGTGWILNELFAVQRDVSVCYVEASSKMISLAREKSKNDNRVQFIHGTESDIPSMKFDAVITNFYLDLFREDSLRSVLQKIKSSQNLNGQWIITDFVETRRWQSLMLALMYSFFKLTSQIEANQLPDWSKAMEELSGKKMDSKSFCRNFIQTVVFQF